MKRTHTRWLGAVVLAGALALGGCGGNGSGTTSPGGNTGTGAGTTGTATTP